MTEGDRVYSLSLSVSLSLSSSTVLHKSQPGSGDQEAEYMGPGQSEEKATGHKGELLSRDARSNQERDSPVLVPGPGREQATLTAGKEGEPTLSVVLSVSVLHTH